jgi:hypothetical protein
VPPLNADTPDFLPALLPNMTVAMIGLQPPWQQAHHELQEAVFTVDQPLTVLTDGPPDERLARYLDRFFVADKVGSDVSVRYCS